MIDKRISFRGGGMDAGRSDFGSSSSSSRSSSSSKSSPSSSGGGGGGGTSSSGSNGDNNRENYRTSTQYITSATPEAIKRNARAFEVGVDPAYDAVVGPRGPYQPGSYGPFRDVRPEMPNIPFGIGDLFMRMVNPGGKGALQMFSDFSANKNRNYFMDEVVRAGKIPGLNYGTVADMTGTELEAAYKNYLSSRGSGSIDAYGNPIGGQDKPGITSIYDARPYQMAQNIEVEDPVQNLFSSRFLQNRTSGEREEIEANMPIRFPNLFT